MLNEHLLLTQQDFNDFTHALRKKIIFQKTSEQKSIKVQMRNKLWVDVCYRPESEDDESHFYSPDFQYVWWLDGSSVTSKDFDLICFED